MHDAQVRQGTLTEHLRFHITPVILPQTGVMSQARTWPQAATVDMLTSRPTQETLGLKLKQCSLVWCFQSATYLQQLPTGTQGAHHPSHHKQLFLPSFQVELSHCSTLDPQVLGSASLNLIISIY